MEKIITLIKTSRPIYWVGHWSMFLFGAIASERFSLISVKLLGVLLLLSLPFSLFVYAINDYYDLASDKINNRKGGKFGVVYSEPNPRWLLYWGFIGLAIALLAAMLILPWRAFLVFLLTSLILYGYSAPPLRLKSIPIIDALTGGGLYGVGIATVGYLFFEPRLFSWSQIPENIMLILILSTVMHLMFQVVDIVPDKKQGIVTSAVFFGPLVMTGFCLIVLLFTSQALIHTPLFKYFLWAAAAAALPYFNARFRQTSFAKRGAAEVSLYSFYLLTAFQVYQRLRS